MQRALLYAAELIYAQAKTNMDESIGESQLLLLQFSQTYDEKLELFIVQNNQDKLIQQFEGTVPAAAVGS